MKPIVFEHYVRTSMSPKGYSMTYDFMSRLREWVRDGLVGFSVECDGVPTQHGTFVLMMYYSVESLVDQPLPTGYSDQEGGRMVRREVEPDARERFKIFQEFVGRCY